MAVSKLKIGMNVKVARTKANLTLIDIAKRTGLSITTLSHIENGVQNVRISTLTKIAEVIGVPVDDLLKE